MGEKGFALLKIRTRNGIQMSPCAVINLVLVDTRSRLEGLILTANIHMLGVRRVMIVSIAVGY